MQTLTQGRLPNRPDAVLRLLRVWYHLRRAGEFLNGESEVPHEPDANHRIRNRSRTRARRS